MTPDEARTVANLRRKFAAKGPRAIRESLYMSTPELGKAIGADRSTVRRWETEGRQPSAEHLLAYARLLAELA